jgi:hypothetical protein
MGRCFSRSSRSTSRDVIMCGIFGMFDPVRPVADSARDWAEQAQRRLQHRGPAGLLRKDDWQPLYLKQNGIRPWLAFSRNIKNAQSWVSPQVRWRSKQGFTPPPDTWFRTSLRRQMEEAIEDISRRLCHVIVPTRVSDVYQHHQAGADQSPLLFRWLVLSRSLTQARGVHA